MRLSEKQKAELIEWVKSIGIAALLAAFIMVFIGRSYVVEGSSMHPSLEHGERLVIDKLTYRFRPPERGEVIVFRYPADPRDRYIKRVIGVPGDVVEVRDGSVFVNGTRLDEAYLEVRTLGRFGPVTVPVDHVFVLGDNRNLSKDSRHPLVGFVPESLIVGRAVWRYWPITKFGGVVNGLGLEPL